MARRDRPLDQLERAGLVQRLRDPHDRRGVLVELTDKEREQLNELLRRLMEFEKRGIGKEIRTNEKAPFPGLFE